MLNANTPDTQTERLLLMLVLLGAWLTIVGWYRWPLKPGIGVGGGDLWPGVAGRRCSKSPIPNPTCNVRPVADRHQRKARWSIQLSKPQFAI
jgi:hypothetical protein